MEIKKYISAAGDVVLPRVCVVCGGRLNSEERHICLECLADMPLTRFWERSRNPMADKFNEKINGVLTSHEPYAFATALFFYHSEAGYRHIPYQIKYHGNTATGKYFGGMLGRKLAGRKQAVRHKEEIGREKAFGPWADVDMIIPVPLHWTRQWKRGYNQAEVIAGAMAETMGVRMRTDILERRRRTKTQTKLGIEDKTRNVAGAFAVRRNIAVLSEAEGTDDTDIRNIHHILVVDDVFTTGSTLASCFAALRKVFPAAVRISVAALGYLER